MTNYLLNDNGTINFNAIRQLELYPNEIAYNLPENPYWKITSLGRVVRYNHSGKINFTAGISIVPVSGKVIASSPYTPKNLIGKKPEHLLALIDNIPITPETKIKYKDKNANNFSKDNIIFYTESSLEDQNAAKMELEDMYENISQDVMDDINNIIHKHGIRLVQKVLDLTRQSQGV